MRRFLLAFGVMILLCGAATAAFAAVGDAAGYIYTTDILVQVDGRAIPSYSIDGRTMIALEDLRDYGFTVTYDDSVRLLQVLKTGEADPAFQPSVPRGQAGEISGEFYETDIQALVNGLPVTAYAIDGRMAAVVEELGTVSEESFSKNERYGLSGYFMRAEWNEGDRLLSLDTSLDSLPDREGLLEDYLDLDAWTYSTLETLVDTPGFLAVRKAQSGTPHGTSYTIQFFYPNGIHFRPDQIWSRYGLVFDAYTLPDAIQKLQFDEAAGALSFQTVRMGIADTFQMDIKTGVVRGSRQETMAYSEALEYAKKDGTVLQELHAPDDSFTILLKEFGQIENTAGQYQHLLKVNRDGSVESLLRILGQERSHCTYQDLKLSGDGTKLDVLQCFMEGGSDYQIDLVNKTAVCRRIINIHTGETISTPLPDGTWE